MLCNPFFTKNLKPKIMTKKPVFIAFVVSLGGFLFGFDAGIISGVMSFANPEFDLTDIQS